MVAKRLGTIPRLAFKWESVLATLLSTFDETGPIRDIILLHLQRLNAQQEPSGDKMGRIVAGYR
jgi:hypothetical protein